MLTVDYANTLSNIMDRGLQSVRKLRTLLEEKTVKYNWDKDVELNETTSILQRWDGALKETERRMKRLEIIFPKITVFVDSLNEELSWLVKTKEIIHNDVPGGLDDLDFAGL